MSTEQSGVLWRDLARAGGGIGDPDPDNWNDRQWRDFYLEAAIRFKKLHIVEDD